ncbi:MAG: hypothetical protein GY795_09390 [Desulfobacterales bacterium]|nr:hypothetical protein [Desulfobacterales bacterium]
MNKPIKGAVIFFAMFSLIIFATCASAQEDWSFDFDIGLDVSGYDTGKADYDGFSNLKIFFGLSGKQQLSERLAIFEELHYRAINIEEPQAVARDMDSLEVSLGMEYVLTPWPPPVLRRFKKSSKWLPTLNRQTRVYFKAMGSYLFTENNWIDQSHFNTTFFGVGMKYNKPDSKMDRSYIEFGTGSSERFDSTWRYIKINMKFYYQLSDSNKDAWKTFLSTELDVGSGDDDIRFGLGFTRDAAFLGKLLKSATGVK